MIVCVCARAWMCVLVKEREDDIVKGESVEI
jgi:hypothetical protein